MSVSSPLKYEGVPMTNFVPYIEINKLKSDNHDNNVDEGTESLLLTSPLSPPSLLINGGLPHPLPLKEGYPTPLPSNGTDVSTWRKNYVSCADLSSFLKKSGGTAKGDERDTHEIVWRGEQGYASKSVRGKKGACQRLREEFSLSNFKLEHKAPFLFVTSQWQRPSQMCCMYLTYRLFWSVYFTMWSVWSWVGFGGYDAPLALKPFYLIYLTNWGIWLIAIDTTVQSINVVQHMRRIAKRGDDSKYTRMKPLFKASWVLSNVTATLHVFITLTFWTAIFPHGPYSLSTISVNTHIIPCAYVVLDCLVAATPRRMFHAVHAMLTLTLYGFFTYVYYLAGGMNHRGGVYLYPILNWTDPPRMLLFGSGLVLILIPIIHIIFVCGLYGVRMKWWRNLNCGSYHHGLESSQFIAMEEKV